MTPDDRPSGECPNCGATGDPDTYEGAANDARFCPTPIPDCRVELFRIE